MTKIYVQLWDKFYGKLYLNCRRFRLIWNWTNLATCYTNFINTNSKQRLTKFLVNFWRQFLAHYLDNFPIILKKYAPKSRKNSVCVRPDSRKHFKKLYFGQMFEPNPLFSHIPFHTHQVLFHNFHRSHPNMYHLYQCPYPEFKVVLGIMYASEINRLSFHTSFHTLLF